jgi:hypothetical protein
MSAEVDDRKERRKEGRPRSKTHLEALLGRELGRTPSALEDGAERPVARRDADDGDVLAEELVGLLVEDVGDLFKDRLAVRLNRAVDWAMSSAADQANFQCD